MAKVNYQEVKDFLKTALDSFPHDYCQDCECFLGFVTQLRVDSDSESHNLLKQYRVDRNNIHSCLGCDPCPPGDLYAEYVRNKKGPQIITLD